MILNELNTKGTYTITKGRWIELVKDSVKELNPYGKNELTEQYFYHHPFTVSSRGAQGDHSNPGGFLYNRYLKLRQLLNELGLITDADEILPEGKHLCCIFQRKIFIKELLNVTQALS